MMLAKRGMIVKKCGKCKKRQNKIVAISLNVPIG
jgi:hypothetical protein